MRTREKYSNSLLAALALAGLLCLAGCATPASISSGAEDTGKPEQSEPLAIEPWDGDGMEIPLDGSSMKQFEAYMARVKKYSKAEDYTTLEDAIQYLLFYDLSVKRDKEKLVAKLDGLTGYEILAKVGWRQPPPGKSKAEKGAANAKIIDT